MMVLSRKNVIDMFSLCSHSSLLFFLTALKIFLQKKTQTKKKNKTKQTSKNHSSFLPTFYHVYANILCAIFGNSNTRFWNVKRKIKMKLDWIWVTIVEWNRQAWIKQQCSAWRYVLCVLLIAFLDIEVSGPQKPWYSRISDGVLNVSDQS